MFRCEQCVPTHGQRGGFKNKISAFFRIFIVNMKQGVQQRNSISPKLFSGLEWEDTGVKFETAFAKWFSLPSSRHKNSQKPTYRTLTEWIHRVKRQVRNSSLMRNRSIAKFPSAGNGNASPRTAT